MVSMQVPKSYEQPVCLPVRTLRATLPQSQVSMYRSVLYCAMCASKPYIPISRLVGHL